MPNFQILADELTDDLLGRGYAGMDDQAASVDLNTSYRDLWAELTSSQIFEAIVATEFQALNAANQARVDRLLGLGDGILSVPGSQARTEMVAVFGGGSTTIANLLVIAQQSQTRSRELAWGRSQATTSDVNNARTL